MGPDDMPNTRRIDSRNGAGVRQAAFALGSLLLRLHLNWDRSTPRGALTRLPRPAPRFRDCTSRWESRYPTQDPRSAMPLLRNPVSRNARSSLPWHLPTVLHRLASAADPSAGRRAAQPAPRAAPPLPS